MAKAKTKATSKAKSTKKSAAKKKPPAKAKKKPAVKKKPAAKNKPAAKKKPAKKAAPKASLTWSTREELSAAWNAAGRAYYGTYNALLKRLYGGENVNVDVEDTRTAIDGTAVVTEIIAMNAAGDGERARELFDPAYRPVMEWIKSNSDTIGFVALMGTDDVLAYNGSPWKTDGTAWHLRGGKATKLPGILGFNRSRNRDHLVVARENGLAFYNAREGVEALYRAPVATLPWPSMDILRPAGMNAEQEAAYAEREPETRIKLESLQIDDAGERVVMTAYRQGILLASRKPGDPPWQLLYPTLRADFDHDSVRCGDMTHATISRDGTRLAFGSQDTPHFAATIGERGDVVWYASAGMLSEYPHYAVFSDDGRYTAFNACHFYNGATVCFDWEGNQGKRLPNYEVTPGSPGIEGGLRVYAGCWLPPDVSTALTGTSAAQIGAFALAGSGIMRFVSTTGKILAVQGFGSSAGSIDFDPETKRLALAGYSGFVHIYDTLAEEEPGRIDGVRPRKEVARWALWPRLPNGPIRW